MRSGPPKILEALVAILIPPACREEVTGDLRERYRAKLPYAAEAFATLPLVILSRMRRVTDPQIFLIQAFALYLSFTGAAWLRDREMVGAPWGQLRLAIPAAAIIVGLLLEDTYAAPGRRSPLKLARGPLLGAGMAIAFQQWLSANHSGLALPHWILFCGCTMGVLFSSAVRILFRPPTEQAGDRFGWYYMQAGDGFDGFFLAMTQWRLGRKDEAQKSYEQAVQWMEQNAPECADLRRYRGEAEQMLSVKPK